MYKETVTIPGLPKTTNGGFKNNWRAVHAERKKWKAAIASAFFFRRPSFPLLKAQITLVRHSSAEPDFDGLVSSFKSILDGLTESGIIKDDKMSVIGQPVYKWKKAPPKKGFIEISIEEL